MAPDVDTKYNAGVLFQEGLFARVDYSNLLKKGPHVELTHHVFEEPNTAITMTIEAGVYFQDVTIYKNDDTIIIHSAQVDRDSFALAMLVERRHEEDYENLDPSLGVSLQDFPSAQSVSPNPDYMRFNMR